MLIEIPRKFLITSILFMLPCLLHAQNGFGSITGIITDSENIPVPNAYITISRSAATLISDNEGRFAFESLNPGKYDLKISHIGYQLKIIKDILVSENSGVTLDQIRLKEQMFETEAAVITATRSRQETYELSTPVNSVSAIKILERNSKTTAEALREENGIFVQKTNHGGGSAIIRGFGSNRILILVDGIRLNNSTYRLGNHQYLTTVDNQNLEKIEVVRGPSSVLYGSDALGGTINLMTKEPGLTDTEKSFIYSLTGRYSSADEERLLRGSISYRTEKFAFSGGYTLKDYDDLRRGSNSSNIQLENSTSGLLQSPSGYAAQDMDAKLIFSPGSAGRFILSYQLSNQDDVPRYDKYENDGYSKWLYEPQKRSLIYFMYENKPRGKYINEIKSTVSFQKQEEGRKTQKTGSSFLTIESDDVETLGLNLQINSAHTRHLLTAGTDIYHDYIDSRRRVYDELTGISEYDRSGRYPDGAVYDSYGFYVQDETTVSKRFSTTLGVRYNFSHTNFLIMQNTSADSGSNRFAQDFHSVTGSIGGVYKLTGSINITAHAGQAFRAPNLSDLSKLGESKGNTYEVPNPDLDAEKIWSYDLGLRIHTDRLMAGLDAYYSDIADLIASADATYNGLSYIVKNNTEYQVKSKQNIGKAYILGIEASGDYFIAQNLNLRGNITATRGQNKTLDEPVGGIPPVFGLLGFKWTYESGYADFYFRFADKQNRLSSDDKDDPRIPAGGTPGWRTYNIRVGYTYSKNVEIRLAMENITDVNYREHGSGINGPGRNLIAGFTLRH
ncbi:MAG: TonB-dependent receptor [Calditrichaceae bacterium]